MRCESCDAELPEGVNVCSSCGHVTDDAAREQLLATGLIPIDTIEGASTDEYKDEPFVPQALVDDPDTGDGSINRDGVEVSEWQLHTLSSDRLKSVSEPSGRSRKARQTRRWRAASRSARSKEGRSSRGKRRAATAVFVALLVLGAAGAAITFFMEMWGGRTVPNVVGTAQALALSQLEERGFVVEVKTAPSDTVEGHVISVQPPAGERVPEGTGVTLTVGTSRVIPEVVGLSRDDARATLEAAGAENIRFESRVILEEEDNVLEVIPSAGSVFMSSDEITLVVSQLPRVPDVVGEEQDVAMASLGREGIPAHVELERADVRSRLRVVRTEPAAGERAGDEGVAVYVGDPLVEVARLADYFDATAPHIDEFLQGEGFAPKLGHRTQDGHIVASYADGKNATISFVPDPWSCGVDQDQTPYVSVMDDAAKMEGVRLVIDLAPEDATQDPGQSAAEGEAPVASEATSSLFSLTNSSVSEPTVREIMDLCGFSTIEGTCTQSTITLPQGTYNSGHVFYCCSGEEGTYIWTVLVRGESQNGNVVATQAVATCAPRSAYATIDLSGFGNKIGDFVAYQNEYQG